MPELIERGHVYIAQPPLYKMKHGKTERYLKDEHELNHALLELALSNAQIIPRAGAEPLQGEALANIARQYMVAQAVIERESRVIDPLVLHALLSCPPLQLDSQAAAQQALDTLSAQLDPALLQFSLVHDDKNDQWRIRIVRQQHGNSTVTSIDADFLNSVDYQHIKTTAGVLLGLLGPDATVRRGEQGRVIAHFGEALTWLLQEARRGLSIQRYKGLGEMNPGQLWETTMDPNVRRLLKVRIEDAMTADDVFTTLMGDHVEPRRAFIESNALIARNIDV